LEVFLNENTGGIDNRTERRELPMTLRQDGFQDFEEFFEKATGYKPYPYQKRFATEGELPQLINVPTGVGKTAAVVMGWLWRRRFASEEVRLKTPRRLVYCLPMRVLVEQTRDCACKWLDNIGLRDTRGPNEKTKDSAGTSLHRTDSSESTGQTDSSEPTGMSVYVLMGGENEGDWDIYPEKEAILIGTQDMLLSRLLNRGYTVSRSRWPIQFGQLNTDCLWVFDEIQLMGAGLATTAQMEAFRYLLSDSQENPARDGQGCRSIWMSATIRKDWLKTVDFASLMHNLLSISSELEDDDRRDSQVKKLLSCRKPLAKANGKMGEMAKLASDILSKHKTGTRTIVVLNTVERAREMFDALNNACRSNTKKAKHRGNKEVLSDETHMKPPADIILLHSRFRPTDRKNNLDKALAEVETGKSGTLIVSTQVIEAGVDVSATTLFTELAPWASLVQRFGRCNRRGEDDQAQVLWIDLPPKKPDAEKVAQPYRLEDLNLSLDEMKKLTDVSLCSLPEVELHFEHTHVIRIKDLKDLFDTTPDLAGNDIDIDRFVREIDSSDVRVYWRDWEQSKGNEPPPEDSDAPRQEELCSAPVHKFKEFAKQRKGKIWRWSFLDKRWEPAAADRIAPGQLFLAHADAGGYSASYGWNPDSQQRVEPLDKVESRPPDSTENDVMSHTRLWQTIADHTQKVGSEMDSMLKKLNVTMEEKEILRHSAIWHDRGKAHDAFIAKLNPGALQSPDANQCMIGNHRPAKAPDEAWVRGRNLNDNYRQYFRHELASALAVLLAGDNLIPAEYHDLVSYLVAAHHGKVRLSIRSLPNERINCEDGRRFARGVWDGDVLPATELGYVLAPAVTLSLEPMELGLCRDKPFQGQPSWAERVSLLFNKLGPFRLAYLESILRAADIRASI
jgi:CRISPR-associated endonuclease/helicase Cas3